MPKIKMGVGWDEDLEDKPVPRGTYDLKIIKVDDTYKSEKTGGISTRCIIKVESPEHPNAANIFYYLGHISPGDDPDKRRFKMRFNKRFCDLFGITMDAEGFDTDSMLGATARADIDEDTNDRDEPVNTVVLPRVDSETPASAKGGRRRQ